MIRILKRHVAEIILFIIVLLLAFTNYEKGFSLTGWDNLQTDLNPLLGVKRALWSGWQEYQSFGLPSGMAHASDMVRALLTVALSLILPAHLVRYTLHFIMILLGTLGAYKLIKYMLAPKELNNDLVIAKEPRSLWSGRLWRSHTLALSCASFLGALFYLLNWGTIQILFFAYDGFTIFFGMLPWLTLAYLSAIHSSPNDRTRSLMSFAAINILATPSWYSQQLFVVYMAFLAFFTLGILLANRSGVLSLTRRSLLLVAITLAINSFWILPQMYFLYSNIGITYSAKVNQIHTPKTVMENKDKGTLYDFLMLNSFYADYVDVQGKHFLGGWLDYRSGMVTKYLVILLGILPLLGFVKKGPYRISLFLAYGMCVLILLTNTPPISHIDAWLRQISIYNQILRTPFTKVISIYTLVLSILFAKSLYDFAKSKLAYYTFFVASICALVILAWPAFGGELFSSQVKSPIPSAYLELTQFMATVDASSRVTLLPDTTFWGWYKHSWGYNGSGFLWYAIEQPFVSRTFDVWSDKSEKYYWELRHAVDTRNTTELKIVFTKYSIRYVILDDTLVSTENRDTTKELDFLENSLTGPDYRLAESIPIDSPTGKIGTIKIFEVLQTENKNGGRLLAKLPNISSSKEVLASGDKAYEKHGDYISDTSKSYALIFPFHDFSTAKEMVGGHYSLDENERTISISKKLSGVQRGYGIITSDIYPLIQTNYIFDEKTNTITQKSTRLDNLEVLDNQVLALFSTEPVYDLPLETKIFGNYKKLGEYDVEYDPISNILHTQARDGANPYWEYVITDTEISDSYIIFIDGVFTGPQRPLFTVMRHDNRQIILTGLLHDGKNYFIIPRNELGALGLALSFSVASYSHMPATYDLKSIRIHPFPVEKLSSIQLTNEDRNIARSENVDLEITKHSYFKYSIAVDGSRQESTFVLNQAFDEGWVAHVTDNTWFPFFGTKLENHVLVNNWANGWRLESKENKCVSKTKDCGLTTNDYVIVFWPQYLQYLGFGILLTTLATLGFLSFKHHQTPLADNTKLNT